MALILSKELSNIGDLFTYCIIFTAFSGLEASVPASNLDGAPDLRRALSLLSTNSWGSVNPGQSSLAHFVNTNHNSVGHPATTQAVNTSAGYWQDQHTLPQQERVVPFDLHNNGSQYQEFQLSKSPYETSFFDSGQMLSKSDGHFLFKTWGSPLTGESWNLNQILPIICFSRQCHNWHVLLSYVCSFLHHAGLCFSKI